MISFDEQIMQRCLLLAAKGLGYVAPNPMVGAVLVHDGNIIAEGWHAQFGGPHAEVNCLNNVPKDKQPLIAEATLYVSLEPCNHEGKTPPCTHLIVNSGIKKVVVAIRDPYDRVNGTGIAYLQKNGVEVIEGICEEAARALNKRFFTFHEKRRPYVILKWAQSADGFIAPPDGKRVQISNDLAHQYSHRWRAEEAALLVGKNTARNDNPHLTVRYWKGRNPIRMVWDPNLELPNNLKVFDEAAPTIIFNNQKAGSDKNIRWVQEFASLNFVAATLKWLFENNYNSLIVEGGAKVLQQFIDAQLWDEARVFTAPHTLSNGIKAPQIIDAHKVNTAAVGDNTLQVFVSSQNDYL